MFSQAGITGVDVWFACPSSFASPARKSEAWRSRSSVAVLTQISCFLFLTRVWMCVCVCVSPGVMAEASQSLEQQADGRLSNWRGASRAQTGRNYAKAVP